MRDKIDIVSFYYILLKFRRRNLKQEKLMKTNKSLLAALPLVVAPLYAYGKAHKTQAPNIIFILCDDMGYGDLACYGQPYISTPNIDRMAAEGMRFTQAYAGSPVSAPSRATLMTGQHSGHTRKRQQGILVG